MTDAEGVTGGDGVVVIGGSGGGGEILLFACIVAVYYSIVKVNTWFVNFSFEAKKLRRQKTAQAIVAAGSTPATPNNTGKNNKGSRRSDKEKSTDKPSWVDRSDIDFSQTPQQNAERIMNNKFGEGNWKPRCRDYSKIVKWIQRDVLYYK